MDRSFSRARGLTAICAIAALLVLLASAAPARALPPGFQDNAVISGLDLPTTVRFSPDGRVFVAEKSGLIKVYSSLADTTPTTFADLRTSVYDYWDRGLLGLELHPNFPATPWVYALYSHDAPIGGTAPDWNDDCPDPPGANSDGCLGSGRLVKLTAAGDVMTGAQQVLIEDWCIQFTTHSIGDLEFGPDGALYVSGGDGAGWLNTDYGQMGDPVNPCGDPTGGVSPPTPPTAEGGALRSQDLRTSGDPTSLHGAILRVNPDTGAALPDNPLASSSDPNARRILSYGARNPFRFAFRPGTSEIWFGDVGMDNWEEINRIQSPLTAPVENFGWPCYEGTGPHAGYDAANLNICEGLYSESIAERRAIAPYFTYLHSAKVVPGEVCPTGGSSISGMAFYNGGSYPDSYDGALFFADYSRACIWAMPTNGGTLPDPDARLTFTSTGGPVDLEVGPNGDIFYPSISGGTIRRITYQAGNQPPIANATADPTSGPLPLLVEFDATGSTDPENDPLSFAWDLDEDNQFDDSTSATPQRTFNSTGNHTATVRVRDPSNNTSFDSVTVNAGGSPPTADIDSPSSSFAWKVGDQIQFSGDGDDAQDGDLTASRFSWEIDQHHCPSGGCHVHTVRRIDDVESGSFFAPDHDFPSHITVRLTVTDSDGLTDSDEVRIDPQTAQLTVNAAPTGLQLGLDADVVSGPFTKTVIVGSGHSVTAPSPQALAGTNYAFSSWSDGLGQSHNFTVNANRSLTAQFQATGAAQAGSLAFAALPPNTLIRRGPRKRTRDSTPTFRFRSPGGGASAFHCRVDGGEWSPCASPLTISQLRPGRHVFHVRSVGSTGLLDRSAAKRRFKVLTGGLGQRAARAFEQAAEGGKQATGALEQWSRVLYKRNQFTHWGAFCKLPQAGRDQRA